MSFEGCIQTLNCFSYRMASCEDIIRAVSRGGSNVCLRRIVHFYNLQH